MDAQEATQKFKEADALFRIHDWNGALEILAELDVAYPDQHRILYPMARCLAELRRFDESLALCTQLVNEYGYQRAERLRERLIERAADENVFNEDFDPRELEPPSEPSGEEYVAEESERRVRLPLKRAVLVAILGAAMWQQWIPLWLGIAGIAAVLGTGFVLGRLFRKALEAPFKMKAQALRGAKVEVHSVGPAQPPDEDSDDEGDTVRAYYLIECTITPAAPGPNQKFHAWEPGELALAEAGRKIKSLDDQDECYSISNCWIVENGKPQEDEGYKLDGARRIRLLVGLPPEMTDCQFVYYSEAFGRVSLTRAYAASWTPEEQQTIETQLLPTPDFEP